MCPDHSTSSDPSVIADFHLFTNGHPLVYSHVAAEPGRGMHDRTAMYSGLAIRSGIKKICGPRKGQLGVLGNEQWLRVGVFYSDSRGNPLFRELPSDYGGGGRCKCRAQV